MKKILILVFALIASIASVDAQSYGQGALTFYNPLNTAGVYPESDTVTNAATNYITTRTASTNAGPGIQTTVVVNITKISGTVGGTITLQGSLDGTTYTALTTQETATALATLTAADATATRTWRIIGNPYRYYRVSWTGTGTMSASFSAKAYSK